MVAISVAGVVILGDGGRAPAPILESQEQLAIQSSVGCVSTE
jgi:hypothetical protein